MRSPPALLEIAVRWGGDALHVVHLSPPSTFRLGGAAMSPHGLALSSEVLGVPHAALVRVDATGRVWLVVVPRAEGTLQRRGGALQSLARLVEESRGRASDEIPGAWEVAFPLGSRAVVTIGALRFDVTHEREGWRARRRYASAGARALIVGLTMALSLSTVVASAFAVPRLGSTEGAELDGSQEYRLLSSVVVMQGEREMEEKRVDDEPTPSGDGREASDSRCGDVSGGSQGEPTARPVSWRYGVRGPSDNPDPHIAATRERGAWEISEAPIGRPTPAWEVSAPTMPWGRDDEIGNDPASARGNAWGDEIGVAFGSPGIGMGKHELCPECGDSGRGPSSSPTTTALLGADRICRTGRRALP